MKTKKPPYDKDYNKVIEILSVEGWPGLVYLPNSFKEMINDVIKATKKVLLNRKNFEKQSEK